MDDLLRTTNSASQPLWYTQTGYGPECIMQLGPECLTPECITTRPGMPNDRNA